MPRLTNGSLLFDLYVDDIDDRGPRHGTDLCGSGYTRCSAGCDHGDNRCEIWHDDSHTETLWVAAEPGE